MSKNTCLSFSLYGVISKIVRESRKGYLKK